MNTQQLIESFFSMSDVMQSNKQLLCELDGVIGDADHGVTMALGFNAIKEVLKTESALPRTPTEVFNLAAKTFLNAVGASAGPLYATAFMRAGASLKGIESIDAASAATMIEAMATGIQERGKAQAGDKTMLDAWLPAAVAARNAATSGAVKDVLVAAANAADAGATETTQMLAKKGRAAKLGERSIGHQDAGARSTALLLQALAQADPSD